VEFQKRYQFFKLEWNQKIESGMVTHRWQACGTYAMAMYFRRRIDGTAATSYPSHEMVINHCKKRTPSGYNGSGSEAVVCANKQLCGQLSSQPAKRAFCQEMRSRNLA